jgi:hypothetical protein
MFVDFTNQIDPLNGSFSAILGAVLGIPVTLWVNRIYERSKQKQKDKENVIEITDPLPDQFLQNPRSAPSEPNTVFYSVKGKLGYLPEGHAIWLLRQSRKTNEIWPQGRYPVKYNRNSGTWEGFIRADSGLVKIVAVIAPRSSHQMFEYQQAQGGKTNWAPLYDIPEECKNRATIHALAP